MGGIRESLNQELVLGRDDFKERIKRLTNRQVKPAKVGRRRNEVGAYKVS